MIKSYKIESIILARRNFGEADKFVTVFSKQTGKKTVIAKGVRRIKSRRAPHIELFSHTVLILHPGKTFDLITEAVCLENFSLARQKIERIGFIYIALELTQRLTAELVPTPVIFDQLLRFLNTLNHPATRRPDALRELNLYKEFMLSELGFLHPARSVSGTQLDMAIEEVLESTLKSTPFLTRIQSLV